MVFSKASLAPLTLLCLAASARAEGRLVHDTIQGSGANSFEIVTPNGLTEHVRSSDLGSLRTPGKYTLHATVAGANIRIPHCNGRGVVTVDGVQRGLGPSGPWILSLGKDGAHDVRVEMTVSSYEKRIACGEDLRGGSVTRTGLGLSLFRFQSPHKGPWAGEAVVYVPRHHDLRSKGALLVGLHPWNGGPWTYAAYRELLDEADAKDVVLLMPSGLGNSLYTENAEDEVMLAIDALAHEIAIDPQRISIWGASMGGQGATTIAFHRPDRFAFVASYFGDSKFDRTTYVRSLLPSEDAAHKVNALDVVDNARHLPVWLVHGENDRTSRIEQSAMLFDAMKQRHFKVDFDRVPSMGHEGPLVIKFVGGVVDRAANAHAPTHPSRVSFRSTRSIDTEAYGVRIVRAGPRDAFVDIERSENGIVVLPDTDGVSEILLKPDALGAQPSDPIKTRPGVRVRWAPP